MNCERNTFKIRAEKVRKKLVTMEIRIVIYLPKDQRTTRQRTLDCSAKLAVAPNALKEQLTLTSKETTLAKAPNLQLEEGCGNGISLRTYSKMAERTTKSTINKIADLQSEAPKKERPKLGEAKHKLNQLKGTKNPKLGKGIKKIIKRADKAA
ncbi:hypothetical protein V8C43DRAFT_314463 [Trichoderma afarasin]